MDVAVRTTAQGSAPATATARGVRVRCPASTWGLLLVVRVPQTLVPAECTDHYRQVVKPQSIEGDKNGYKGKLIDFQHFNVYLTSTKPLELVIMVSCMAERCDCCSSIKKLCVKILTIYRGALNV